MATIVKSRTFKTSKGMTPAQALTFAKSIAKGEGIAMPTFHVRRCNLESSSGRTWQGFFPRVLVTLGTDPKDNKNVIVHEMAHVLTDRVRGQAHGDAFYDTFWRLAVKYRLNIPHALQREAAYKVRSSLKMAKTHKIPGAYKAAREEKARRTTWTRIKKEPLYLDINKLYLNT